MARRRRVHKTSPKTPSRVKKRRGGKKPRARAHVRHAHHYPELIGLALGAIGVFLAAVLWLGFSGGPVGDLVQAGVGAAAYIAPLVLVPLGALMVAKSELVDVRPFRLGLGVALTGLVLTLGSGHGGALGDALESLVALGLGTTGATILGVLLTLGGTLFLTGASLGAIVRRSGHAVQRAHTTLRATRQAHELDSLSDSDSRAAVLAPPVDVKHDYPDLVSDTISGPAPTLFVREPGPVRGRDARVAGAALRSAADAGGRLPATRPERAPEVEGRHWAERRRQPARRRRARDLPCSFRRRGDRDRPDLGPARHALRAPARARERRSARSRTSRTT